MNKSIGRIVSLVMAMALAIGMMPGALAASIGVGTGAGLVVDISGLSTTGNQVYFGTLSGNTIKWRIVAKDATTVTLFCDGSVDDMAYDTSHSGGRHQDWSDSDICAWLNGLDFLGNISVFNAAERGAMAAQYSTTSERGCRGPHTLLTKSSFCHPWRKWVMNRKQELGA